MEIKGLYGEALVKAFKLSEAMVDAITDNVNAVKPATVKALATRELMSHMVIAGRVTGELTDLGEHVRVHLMGAESCETCMCDAGMSYEDRLNAVNNNISAVDAIAAHLASEDHPTGSDMITDTPCDACGKPADQEALYKDGVISGLCADAMCLEVAMDADCVFRDVIGGSEIRGHRADMITDAAGGDETGKAITAKIRASGLRGKVKLTAQATRFYDESRGQQRSGPVVGTYDPNHVAWDVETNELPYDAERTFDVENAAAEAADIRAEYEAELIDELITEVITDDRLMHLTPEGVFVSGSYVNTMRRIASESCDRAARWQEYRRTVLAMEVQAFASIDEWVSEGKISFGVGDKQKRIIRNVCRPHIGDKRKPSAKRRNRR